MKILMIANNIPGLLSFRKECVEAFIKNGYDVLVVAPHRERASELKALGARVQCIDFESHGTNPVKDLVLIGRFVKVMFKERPNVMLSYTIKPNLYGGFAARLCGVPQVANITGLGTAVENPGALQKLIFLLYRICLKRAKMVFFQNETNKDFCIRHRLVSKNWKLIPGSGVNLQRFTMEEYPSDEVIRFIFISRLIKQKGIELYIETALAIKKEFPNTEFHILGDGIDYVDRVKELTEQGIVVYHGRQSDVRAFIKKSHCTIHPTYYPEGMSNVLLESCAIGRPIITTNRPGCGEIVDDKVNGFVVCEQDAQDLIAKVRQFINLTYEEKARMGRTARAKVECEFDREIVTQAYLDEVKNIIK